MSPQLFFYAQHWYLIHLLGEEPWDGDYMETIRSFLREIAKKKEPRWPHRVIWESAVTRNYSIFPELLDLECSSDGILPDRPIQLMGRPGKPPAQRPLRSSGSRQQLLTAVESSSINLTSAQDAGNQVEAPQSSGAIAPTVASRLSKRTGSPANPPLNSGKRVRIRSPTITTGLGRPEVLDRDVDSNERDIIVAETQAPTSAIPTSTPSRLLPLPEPHPPSERASILGGDGLVDQPNDAEYVSVERGSYNALARRVSEMEKTLTEVRNWVVELRFPGTQGMPRPESTVSAGLLLEQPRDSERRLTDMERIEHMMQSNGAGIQEILRRLDKEQ